MNRNLHLPVKLASLLILIALLAMPGVGWGQYSVNFDGASDGTSASAYGFTNHNLNGITWTGEQVIIPTTPLAADWFNGVRSARLRGYSTSHMTMTSNKANGIGTISFNYRRYGTDAQVVWKVEYSTNDGGSWTQAGSDFTAPSNDDIQVFSVTANVSGNARIRIIHVSGGNTSTNRRLNLDDLLITDYAGSTPTITITPTTLTNFTYALGAGPSAEQSFTISGSNLTANVSIDAPANYEISTGTGASFIAADPITLTPESGTLSETTIYVRLKAGLVIGDYNSEVITATSTGATNATVTCSGSVYDQIDWCNLQWPPSGEITLGDAYTVYGQVWIDGVTLTPGATTGLQAWLGYSTEDSNPDTWTNWISADFSNQNGENDEYLANFGAALSAAGTYYYAYRYQYNSAPYVYGGTGGFWNSDNGVLTVNPSTAQIDWCNLQWPASGDITVGDAFNVYAQVYESGVTNSEGQGAGITAWIGFNTANTDPSTWTNWVAATYNGDAGNNDEYMANIAIGLAPGTYYYASRFKYGLAEYVYGGYNASGGGFWDGATNVSGVLTVNAPPMPNAWINEFHYDNNGTDVGEFVEVVVENASGFNLAELRVHLYNGNGGVVYGTSSLDTYTEGATSNGFTIYTLEIPGIQNGSPDGLALSYYNILISGQFLSYEGAFAATDGPAVGVTSVDIGVSENGTGAVTNSLQLGGAGTEYSDFYWQPEAANTSGLVNNNQSFFTSTIWNGSVSTAWELSDNWSQGVPVQGMDVQIPNVTNSPVISTIAACDDLNIAASATVTIAAGALTVGGDLVTNSGLTVQSGGSLITEGSVTGNATVIRNIAGLNQYHFISSPISNAALGNVFPAGDVLNIYLREYNEATGNWVNLSIPANIAVGKGYSFFMDIANTTATFTGTLNNSNVLPMMSNSGTSGNTNYDGWNLLGNPFASAIQWGLGSWALNNVNNEVHVWSNGVYLSYAGGTGSLTDGIIPAQQGFFVKANAPVPSLTIPTASRLHSSQGFYKNNIADLLRLDVSDNSTFTDATFVRFSYDATEEFDQAFDAHKLDNDEAAPMLYTMHGETRFSINTLKSISETPEVPVYFKAGADGGYTINASGMESFENRIIYLTDLLTGLRQDLRQNPVYAFNATTGDDASRFKLSFATVGIAEQPGLNIGVYAANGEIRLQLPEAMRGTVNVASLSGQILLSRNFSASGEFGILTQLPAGIYLVTVVTDQGIATRKVFIN
jgi:hypothetical protein